jgi:mRNA interferase YafQ
MRRIERTTAFRKDYKREKRGLHRTVLDSLISEIVSLLVEDSPLPGKSRDHALSGNWLDHVSVI